MPRVIALLIFLAHTVSALGTSVPPPPNQPQQACVSLKITTTTAKWSKEQAWRIDDGSQGKNWTGSSTGSDDLACIGSIGAQLCEQPPLTKEICLGNGSGQQSCSTGDHHKSLDIHVVTFLFSVEPLDPKCT